MKNNQIIKTFLNKKCFENKTILITGANGVLGKKLCEIFLDLNSKLILIDKKIKKSLDKNIKTLSIDFTNTKNLEKVLVKEKKNFKKLNYIINNAAYTGSNLNWIKPLNFQNRFLLNLVRK